jgi:Fe-S-cluster-containing hydrogenase component 2
MKIVKFLAQVDERKCNGDKLCQTVCPSGAIKVHDGKAIVDPQICVACSHCTDICREEAVRMIPRPEPIWLGTDPKQVDQDDLVHLCGEAHLHPRQFVCLCSATRVEEAAAAILKGASSLEDITRMTGACSGCTLWCTAPLLRLLKAAGIEPDTSADRLLYDITPTLWDVPEDLADRRPGYYLEEDKGVFRKV